MKNQLLKNVFVVLAISFAFFSCSKDDDNNTNNNSPAERKVEYELSGNFTGKLLVVTSTNTGVLQQFDGVAVPWAKEIQYDHNVMGAGISLQTENAHKGLPGQTLTLKVYLNDILKDTKALTADANGTVNSALAFYTF